MTPTDAARAVVGVVLLARPQLALRTLRAPATGRSQAVARLLGARSVAQVALGVLVRHRSPRSGPAVRGADAAVEGAHAASMVGLALLSPRWRRTAAASAALAAAFAAADARAAARAASRGRHDAPRADAPRADAP